MSWSDTTPLAGVKILDLCRVVSGPFATMQLGDLRADVVKIEEPGRGDESRSYGPTVPRRGKRLFSIRQPEQAQLRYRPKV